MLKKIRRSIVKGFKRLLLYFIISFLLSSFLLIGVFRYLPVPITTFMFYRQVTGFQENDHFKAVNHRWVSKDKISKHAFAAVIASEPSAQKALHWLRNKEYTRIHLENPLLSDRVRQLPKEYWLPEIQQ